LQKANLKQAFLDSILNLVHQVFALDSEGRASPYLSHGQSAKQSWGQTGDNVWRPAWDGFRRGFVLAYAVRAGLGTMTRALALARAGQYKDMRGWRLISESGLHYRCAKSLLCDSFQAQ